MRGKQSDEGYVLIDHRNSPGISQEFIVANNLDAPAVGAGQMFESAIAVCHACGGDIILNPNRTRAREWCMEHDAYLCDRCALTRKLTGSCVPLKKRLFDLFERIIRTSNQKGIV
jgi:hypothetical protein